jgi:hypothetical protein
VLSDQTHTRPRLAGAVARARQQARSVLSAWTFARSNNERNDRDLHATGGPESADLEVDMKGGDRHEAAKQRGNRPGEQPDRQQTVPFGPAR